MSSHQKYRKPIHLPEVFFATYLPVFEIRAIIYNHWIYTAKPSPPMLLPPVSPRRRPLTASRTVAPSHRRIPGHPHAYRRSAVTAPWPPRPTPAAAPAVPTPAAARPPPRHGRRSPRSPPRSAATAPWRPPPPAAAPGHRRARPMPPTASVPWPPCAAGPGLRAPPPLVSAAAVPGATVARRPLRRQVAGEGLVVQHFGSIISTFNIYDFNISSI